MLHGLSTPILAQVGPGTTAPPFQACDRLGNQVQLEQFRGRPLILAFMAFWCDTWKPLLSDLKSLNHVPQVLLVAVDSRERSAAEPAMVAADLPFPLLVDIRREVVEKYGVTTVPTILVIDAEGQVRFLHQGYPGNALLQRELAECGQRPQAVGDGQADYLIPEERAVLFALRQERARRGLPALALDTALTDVARERIQRMLEQGTLGHANPDTADQRLRKRGYSFRKLAENLAEAPQAQRALQEMLKSPSHKANMLHPAYTRVGVAALRCGPQGFIYGLLFSQP